MKFRKIFSVEESCAFGDAMDFVRTDLAEVNLVQITFEDLFLRIFHLQEKGKKEFVEFQREISRPARHQIFHELGGDRRTALLKFRVLDVYPDCARDSARIESRLFTEPGILDRDDRLPNRRGNIFEFQYPADLVLSFGIRASEGRDPFGFEINVGNLFEGRAFLGLNLQKLRLLLGVENETDIFPGQFARRIARRKERIGRIVERMKSDLESVTLDGRRCVTERFQALQ
jgi:hypothetical protein